MIHPEITALTYAALLQVAQFVLYSITANKQTGVEYAAGPRDTKHDLTGTAGRLQRALSNHFEGLILFTIAVIVITVSNQSTPLTAICAWVYLAARVAYVPAYVSGIPMLRSIVWFAGLVATTIMLLTAIL